MKDVGWLCCDDDVKVGVRLEAELSEIDHRRRPSKATLKDRARRGEARRRGKTRLAMCGLVTKQCQS